MFCKNDFTSNSYHLLTTCHYCCAYVYYHLYIRLKNILVCETHLAELLANFGYVMERTY